MWRKAIMHYFGIKDMKDKHRAIRTRRRLSIFYAFIGWNCFGVVFYVLLKDKLPTDKEELRRSYMNLTGVPDNIHVFQVTGLKLTKEFDITNNTKNEKETAEIEKTAVKVDDH